MKPSLFILPVAALVLFGGWIGSQQRSISALEQQSAVLKKHISAVRSADPSDDPGHAARDKQAEAKQPLDWKKIAGQMAEMNRGGNGGDMRQMMRLQQRLRDMTSAELLAAFDEIATLDLAEDARDLLESLLIDPLVEKDPEMALTRFIDRVTDESAMSWSLSSALREWAQKDPGSAEAWLDQQISGGKFDSKSLDGESRSRNQFEAAMISAMLGSGVDAAGGRLAALPEDQRANVLNDYSLHSLKEEDHRAYAELVRAQLPENQQANAIANVTYRLSYEKITDYLNRIDATPAERKHSIERAAEFKIRTLGHQRTATREDLDAMREWVSTQLPDSTDRITGKALGALTRDNNAMKFPEAAELAQQYGAASGSEEVLASFLEAHAYQDSFKEEARALAETLTDAKRRKSILSELK